MIELWRLFRMRNGRHTFVCNGLDSFLKLFPKKSSKSPAAQY